MRDAKLLLAGGSGLVLAIAAAKLLLHLATASRYGYVGDELYFLACGEHLDWGYVDQPPLIGLVGWIVRRTLGASLLAVRAPSALAGAALVVLTGLLARELGGGRFAMALAALSSGLAFTYIVMHYLFSMNAFEPLFWTGCAFLLARMARTGEQRLWLAFGALAGLGLQNKYSMAVFAFGLVAGLLASPERRAFAKPWIWLGGALAGLVFLPNVVWNVRHGWPFFELMRNIRASGRDVVLGPVEYVLHQFLNMNPATAPVWLAGLGWLLLSRRGRAFRPLGWAFVITLVTFVASKGKDYYLAPAFATLFAAGAVGLEGFAADGRRRLLRPVLFALHVPMLLFLPLTLPILSPERLVAHQAWLGFTPPATERAHARAALPHHFAWQFGWEEMVAAVARTYGAMPAEEQARVAIIGNNYGESGAVDLLGPRFGLPVKALGTHQSYWLWGP
ncbi:MAG TPA: glycosyltransferase family 39 protein, partial [Vicinamibacteria bacterium]|nr:glycosyltransferase family 39 protein [Vicinamibacteria bacterium]